MQNAALNQWDTTYDNKQVDASGMFVMSEDQDYSNQSASVQKWIEQEKAARAERNQVREQWRAGL